MDHANTGTPAETILHGALELSKNSWLLALQFPDRAQPSLYPISGGDTVGLMAKLTAARDRWAKMSGKAPSIVLCYEAGYDAFWLARFLKARGIECLVVDAASMQVNRRARRAKTDRIDVGMLLRALIAWGQGDRHVWSVVRVPSVDEEDLRRSHRERDRLVRERTAHINRIKGLLFGQGIRGINVKTKYKTLQIDKLVTGDGGPLPPRLASEITREIARLALIQEQIATLERERDQAPTQGHREEETSVDVFDGDRTGHCRRHDTRGLLSPIRQSAAGGRLSRSCNESSRQRRRGAIPRDLPSRARPSARDHDPGRLALAQAPAKECNHPLVCAANCRAERTYPTDHDRCGCAQTGDRAVALP
jgi:transposase